MFTTAMTHPSGEAATGAKRLNAIAPVKRSARAPVQLVQLAMSGPHTLSSIGLVAVTGAFRARLVRRALAPWNGGEALSWWDATPEQRARVRRLAGRDESGVLLGEHECLRVLVWYEGASPTRLVVHADTPLHPWEIRAVLETAEAPFVWPHPLVTGDLSLSRMDAAPPPPGFDETKHRVWTSVTELVPSSVHPGGPERVSRGVRLDDQLARELAVLGRPSPRWIEERNEDGAWVRFRGPRPPPAGRVSASQLGLRLRLTFGEAISGPLLLGHSTSFGLGLFRPDPDAR